MEKGLSIINNYGDLEKVAHAMAGSGYFADSTKASQAIVKIMAGQELGIGPFASMSGIHIIKGKPAPGANIIASLIKTDPRYDYQVRQLDDKACSIEFFENGKPCGISTFTLEDARKAGTQNLEKFPRNMLFARAMSNGAKWFVPGVFNGAPVYTPEELGAEVDEDGDIITGSWNEKVAEDAQQESEQTLSELELAANMRTPKGTRLGDLTADQLQEVIDSLQGNTKKAAVDLLEAAQIVFDDKLFEAAKQAEQEEMLGEEE